MNRLLIFMLVLICCGDAFAEVPRAEQYQFQQGTKLLLNGNANAALIIFNRLNTSHMVTPELYGNMANAYYNNKNYSKALAWYEKALLLAPRDTQLMHNALLANKKLTNATYTRDFLSAAPSTVVIWLDDCLRISALVLFLNGLLFLIAPVIAAKWREQAKKNSLILLVCAASVVMISSVALLYYEGEKYAIVTAPTAVRLGPSYQAKQVAVLNEGDYMQTNDYYKNWLKVKLNDGQFGWIYAADAERIE